jgi:hypothetical protein
MKKLILGGVVLILVLGICAAAIFWAWRPAVIQLSDGTKLTLLGVSYGKHHKLPKVKGGAGRGGAGTFTTTNDILVVWILSEHKGSQWPNYQVLAYDKAATACVGNWSRNSRQIKSGMEIEGVQLDAFPRREGKIYLHVMSWGNRGPQAAKGQFVISNPAGRSFPNWAPDPVPDTQSDGDLNVTLTRCVAGVPGFGGPRNQVKNDPANKAVLAAFHTEQKGVVVTNWQPIRIETTDATGNDAFNSSWSNGRDDNGDATMTYQWGLWPDEPAWKLRVEMSQTSGFSDDEVWTVQNVPVNSGHQQDMWNYAGNNSKRAAFAETTLAGVHLKLYPAIQFTDSNWGNGNKPGGFVVQAEKSTDLDGMQFTLVSVTDEQGHNLQSWGGQSWGGDSHQFQLHDMRNAKTLNLTLALHKSRFVEFTVKPAKP